ncbi:DUF3800 domain-containing protein [Selenihalanaerobacter shriftii]|uniref:DUF3800 domain-containing protein n=1 Tax=Selenihalanaerobacter shriftii TaxID=142842 RepID=A0A1T4MLM5_9FIRM|nr:DUF3800 domain-containing protein [Selenihalanaerobacter shriftii]SJZ67843.1 Protein of unknown function [Selenihalanaerobacter shriftii]
MKEIYVYIDESGNPNIRSYEGDNQYFSIGAAILGNEVSSNLIEKAMNDLKQREDLGKSDVKTLKRGYFHSCVDGPEAHSAIMYLINDLELKFDFLSFDKKKYRQNGNDEFDTEKLLHNHMVELASVFVSNRDVDVVNVFVAERESSFPKHFEKNWKRNFYESLINAVVANTSLLKANFPKVNLKIVDGSHPGIQISDFLLWAIKRSYLSNKNVWFQRIEKDISIETNIKEKSLSLSVDFQINGGVNNIDLLSPYEVTAKEVEEKQRNLNNDELLNLFLHVEKLLDKVMAKKRNELEYMNRFLEGIDKIIHKKEKLTIKEVKKLCKSFIMVFDTLKIHEGYSKEELIFWCVAKRIISNIILGKQINWVMLADFWAINHPNIVDCLN